MPCVRRATAPTGPRCARSMAIASHTYSDAEAQTLPLDRLLEGQLLGTHLYVCGPTGMIDWVLQSARAAGWPDENVHSERFSAPPSGQCVHGRARQVQEDCEGRCAREPARGARRMQVSMRRISAAAVPAVSARPRSSCTGSIVHNDHFLSTRTKPRPKKIMLVRLAPRRRRCDGGSRSHDAAKGVPRSAHLRRLTWG